MLVLNTAQASQITKLALEVTYLVAPKWKLKYHPCKIYSNLNLMLHLVSLSQLNLNSPRKLSDFCYEARATKEGEGGSLAEQFSNQFWELLPSKFANQISSLGLHIYKLLQFLLVSYQVVIRCICKKYTFLKVWKSPQTNKQQKSIPRSALFSWNKWLIEQKITISFKGHFKGKSKITEWHQFRISWKALPTGQALKITPEEKNRD